MNKKTAALGACFVLATAARAEEGCSKDTDCKGERICVQRLCVDPDSKAAGQLAVPAVSPTLPPPVPSGTQAPAAPPTLAPTSTSPLIDTRHRHLGGFIRPDLGFGYLTTSASQGGVDARLSGFAGTFGFSAGGALSENSILALHFWDAVVTDLSYSVGSTSGTASGTLAVFGFGPEYTRYSQQNFYFSISPSLTRMSASSGSSSGDTNWGFGVRAALGKEWWASDHWGLGLVAHLSMSINEDSGSNAPTWTTWAMTVAFSATYN